MKNWRGCKHVDYVWNGTQSDPDLIYKGYTFNYHDIEDALWADFLDATGHTDDEYGNHKVEYEFSLFVQNNIDNYLDDCIYGGYFAKGSKSWHDSI